MNRRLNAQLLGCVAVAVSLCNTVESTTTQEQAPTIPVTGETGDASAPIDEMMLTFMSEHHVPGAGIAIAKNGKLLYERGFGWADVANQEPVAPDALFRIASISKPITAVAIMQLVEAGELSLDDNPFEVIGLGEEIRRPGRDERFGEITIRQLLAHRAGWDRAQSFDPMFQAWRIQKELELDGPPTPEEIIRFMIDQPLDYTPDERYAYSNFGYSILGRVIETVTEQTYEDAVRQRVLAPLGIQSMRIGASLPDERLEGEVVYHDQKDRSGNAVKNRSRRVPLPYGHDQEVMDAHGGWIGSAGDLARFAGAFSNPADSPLLEEKTIRAMWAPQEKTDKPYWYALGWLVRDVGDDRRNAWHNGLLTGGTSTIMVRRHDGYTWAVLFNSDVSADNDKPLAGLIDGPVHRAVNQSFTDKPTPSKPKRIR